ncbi:MAG: FAD:protein FMN transferase [Ruminococcus sp.]|nr:FAD:protein FMN transferase [Ruminococcus sp.]
MKKLLILIMIFIACSCTPSEREQVSNISQTRDIFAMDTYMNLKTYGEDTVSVFDEAENEIRNLEKILSVTTENSDIWKINHSAGNYTDVSSDTLEIIETAVDIGNQTDGNLDITVYPVVREWGFTTGDYKIPDEQTIESLLKNVDFRQIEINNNSVRIPPEFQIDVGSLAKGYTGDKVIDIFRKNGIESAIINLGGNVQTLGTKPDGSMWNVAIKNPFQTDSEICILSVENKAVITSGNYERFFTGDDGLNYWHIIDTTDGKPADNGLVSVTIIGENGLLCDALSTALFVAGTEKAIEYWHKNNDFDMILVTDDGNIIVTEGIENNIRMLSDMTTEVIYHEKN